MDIVQILQPFHLPIDLVMIALVVISGQFQKKYLADVKMKGALLTLIVSFVFCCVYGCLFSLAQGFEKDLPLKWFFSYVCGTSFYELFLHYFLKDSTPKS